MKKSPSFFQTAIAAGPAVVGLLVVVGFLSTATRVKAQLDSSDSQRSMPPSDAIGNQFPSQPVHFDPRVRTASTTSPADHMNRIGFTTPAEPTARHAIDSTSSTIPSAPQDTSPDQVLQSATGMWQQLTAGLQNYWNQAEWKDKLTTFTGDFDIGRMLGSLSLVLGGYFALVWVIRFLNPSASGQVPSEVLEVLGRVPLDPGKNLQIIRLGSKLLLLINGPDGTHPVGEISDPAEVEYLAALCPGRRQAKRHRRERLRQAAVTLANLRAQRTESAATNSATGRDRVNSSDAGNHLTGNHLTSILQTLNGPSGGNAAIFEA